MVNTVRAKQTYKNVVKNLVKENQRIHDYESKFGVKFWNKILKDSKAYGRNNKVFDENVKKVIERDYERYKKILSAPIDDVQKREIQEKLFQLSFFMNGEWRNMINAQARLYPEYRKILYKERSQDKT